MYRKFLLTIIFAITLTGITYAESFTPEQKIIPVRNLKPNMTGYMLTVLKGTKPVRIPVKIISIVPQRPGKNISDLMLVKISEPYKLARGMSGSPIYIQGKLAGAIASGWDFSDHSLALATPIEAMCKIFDFDHADNVAVENLLAGDLTLSGMKRTAALEKLATTLGVNLVQGISMNSSGLDVNNTRLKPGDAISGLLVWGDVELAATGTVTATANDGRFLAFGHPFLQRGSVQFPAARAFIHETVNSASFPFKLASPEFINGTIFQDREAGVGGRFGIYVPSISAELVFRDLDLGTESKYKFRVVADEFLSSKLLDGIYTGLVEEVWGRKGQGTMIVNLRIDGKNIPDGWARKDIFFSDDNITANAFKQAVQIIDAFMTQPFSENMPVGFSLTVEATQSPKALIIEDVETVSRAKPGEEIEITVRLRPWRGEIFTRTFIMKIPEDASGISELIIRGGSVQPLPQTAIEEGWKSINSLRRMLTEINALDANNQLIAELNNDDFNEALRKAINRRRTGVSSTDDDLLPEQQEYLSETKARRIKEGTLKVFNSEYFIDGMMKRIIHVEK